MHITALILTSNEELHIERCLSSVSKVADKIVVVDCFSHDNTLAIAHKYGAQILQHEWINYATQFNWGLDQLGRDTTWVLRLDADEYLSRKLAAEISAILPNVPSEIAGVYCERSMKFQGKMIRFGGIFPAKVLRIFRHGAGRCENRWMDEHVVLRGKTIDFSGEIIDDNHNSLTWWTDKHNTYASREAADLLNLEYRFMRADSVASLTCGNEPAIKRWIKEKIYVRLPAGLRALLYFLYRYVLRLGFLDGEIGLTFHFLQGFWYRYLVDAKLAEVRRYMREHDVDVVQAINDVLHCKVSSTPAASSRTGGM
ncbi:MAG: glycosyl transferase [Desulfobulbaceae bacterium A2]|nr:MAG: glycosyl transferase [Desulfobulbaceae bacterium A2]